MELPADAAAALPVMALLTLAAGRRGNGPLCLYGASALLRLCLFCWPAGLVANAGSYFAQVWHYGNSFSQMLSPLLLPAGRPWLTAFAAWLLGGAAAAVSLALLHAKRQSVTGEKYSLRLFRASVGAGCLAIICFFASLCLINWPFAGLPQDFPMDRAVMAILRNAMRRYFMDFCPAGAFALLGVCFLAGKIDQTRLPLAIRWTAVWAAAGALPHILQNWGMIIGLGMSHRLAGSLAIGQWAPTLGLFCLTLAAFTWCWVIWKPLSWRVMGMAGFGLLLLKTAAPVMFALSH